MITSTHHRSVAARDAGFALVEVLIASLVLVTALAGVAGLATLSLRAGQAARHETLATTLAVAKLEQLRGLTWAFAGGFTSLPVSDMVTDLSREPSTAVGQGLATSPPGTLSANVPGYVDFLDARGVWVGAGPSVPEDAVYVRRWSVEPLASGPSDTLALRVLVTTVRRDAEARAAPRRRSRYADHILLSTLKARKGG